MDIENLWGYEVVIVKSEIAHFHRFTHFSIPIPPDLDSLKMGAPALCTMIMQAFVSECDEMELPNGQFRMTRTEQIMD